MYASGLAVNPREVVDTALNENSKVATSVLAANTPGWVDLSATLVHDPEQATSVPDVAGWTAGSNGIRQKDGQRLHRSGPRGSAAGPAGNGGPGRTR